MGRVTGGAIECAFTAGIGGGESFAKTAARAITVPVAAIGVGEAANDGAG